LCSAAPQLLAGLAAERDRHLTQRARQLHEGRRRNLPLVICQLNFCGTRDSDYPRVFRPGSGRCYPILGRLPRKLLGEPEGVLGELRQAFIGVGDPQTASLNAGEARAGGQLLKTFGLNPVIVSIFSGWLSGDQHVDYGLRRRLPQLLQLRGRDLPHPALSDLAWLFAAKIYSFDWRQVPLTAAGTPCTSSA